MNKTNNKKYKKIKYNKGHYKKTYFNSILTVLPNIWGGGTAIVKFSSCFYEFKPPHFLFFLPTSCHNSPLFKFGQKTSLSLFLADVLARKFPMKSLICSPDINDLSNKDIYLVYQIIYDKTGEKFPCIYI